MLRSVFVLALGISLVAPQQLRILRRPAAPNGGGGGGGGGDNTAPVLTASNFTYLGSAYPPANADWNITVRNVGGTDYLMSTDYTSGQINEYTLPALTTSAPFNTSTTTTAYGDTFGSDIFMHTNCTNGGPDLSGLANIHPLFLGWIEAESKIYWTHICGYEASPLTYDTNLGRGTLNRSNGTGVHEGMWSLALYNTGTPTDLITDVGGRWVNGIMSIPSWFQTYVGGKTLAVGCGNPSTSTASTGPISYGLSLFAVNSTTLGATTNHGIMGGSTMVKLSHYAASMAGNPRMSHGGVSAYQVSDWAHDDVLVDPSSDKMVWGDVADSCAWIDESFGQGIVQPYVLASGTLDTTVTAVSSDKVFTLASVGDARVGDNITTVSDWTTCNATTYPYVTGTITNISGLVVTVDQFICGDYGTGNMPNTNRVVVGTYAHQGNQYLGGGPRKSRAYAVLYIVNPHDLKLVAQGLKSPSTVNPTAIWQLPLPNLTQPFNNNTGSMFNSVGQAAQMTATYSPTTHRLYVYAWQLYHAGTNDDRNVVHVFQVGP